MLRHPCIQIYLNFEGKNFYNQAHTFIIFLIYQLNQSYLLVDQPFFDVFHESIEKCVGIQTGRLGRSKGAGQQVRHHCLRNLGFKTFTLMMTKFVYF